jgi:menaquinol-cytochrome c reductase iron-sulfur subunit
MKAGAVVIGAAATLPPLGAGLATLLDPLRRRSAAGSFLFVTSLKALPEDGTPRQFPVVADRQDAWNRFPQIRVGAVYVRRTGPKSVQAFNAVCPHFGCFVNFVPDHGGYLCPCHNSSFALDGKVQDPRSPSRRGLDELSVEIRNDIEIWVRFQNFLAGSPEKIPV